ncbi:thiol reductase thioredoxin [Aerococcaceae bacterium NML190938]|nr:thiol reductase thioredoxin [Aerococcaceae bacterium NML190938]
MSEIQLFLQQVAAFEEVEPQQAEALIEAKEGNILFIGRETCPYCRRFASKLSKVATEHNLKVYFLHSRHPRHENETQALRDKYGVPTVPGFIYSDVAGIKVKCDSSMPEADILAFVGK